MGTVVTGSGPHAGDAQTVRLDLDPRLVSWLHENSDVLQRTTDDDGNTRCHLRIDATKRGKLDSHLKRAGLKPVPM